MTNGDINYRELREALLADIGQEKAELKQRLEELEKAEQVIHANSDYERQALERTRTGMNMTPLSVEEIRDKSQRAILRLIAEHNRGWLIVAPAIKLMINARVLTEDTGSSQAYTILRQNKDEFVQVAPGIYRLSDGKPAKDLPKREGKTGLVEAVARLRAEHPEWTPGDVCNELLRLGWNFGNKKPIFSVAMAYANIARNKKRTMRQIALLGVSKGSTM